MDLRHQCESVRVRRSPIPPRLPPQIQLLHLHQFLSNLPRQQHPNNEAAPARLMCLLNMEA